MVSNPQAPAPLPPQVIGRPVTRADGRETLCVSLRDAARLMGRDPKWIQRQVNDGSVDVCVDGDETFVLIDSLWLLVPEEERRV